LNIYVLDKSISSFLNMQVTDEKVIAKIKAF